MGIQNGVPEEPRVPDELSDADAEEAPPIEQDENVTNVDEEENEGVKDADSAPDQVQDMSDPEQQGPEAESRISMELPSENHTQPECEEEGAEGQLLQTNDGGLETESEKQENGDGETAVLQSGSEEQSQPPEVESCSSVDPDMTDQPDTETVLSEAQTETE